MVHGSNSDQLEVPVAGGRRRRARGAGPPTARVHGSCARHHAGGPAAEVRASSAAEHDHGVDLAGGGGERGAV
eukprot:947219-Pyramimonas_sp.AAC.1